MTNPDEAAERVGALEAWLEEADEASRAAPLLVEGEKDETTLRALGIRGAIRRVQGLHTVFTFAERLAGEGVREAVVLTDWDRAGGRLARLLAEALPANGIRADLDLRRRLALHAMEIRHVESLDTYLATLRSRVRAAAEEGAAGHPG